MSKNIAEAGAFPRGKLNAVLEKNKSGKKQGIWIVMGIAIICLVLCLPFVNWIRLTNIGKLLSTLSKADPSKLTARYSLFYILSFVQYGNAGKIGLPSMIMFLLMFAVIYFQIACIVKILIGERKYTELDLYGVSEAAMVFDLIAGIGTILYVIFCNHAFGLTGFVPTPAVFLVIILSSIGLAIVKTMQAKEREIQHEHGLWKELKKNWVLFLMLVPTFVYFLINNYLPMLGIYYAFTNFNFRDGLWASPFVGMKNFDFLFKADLWRLTRNTVLYNLAFIFLDNIFQILFAILVSQVTVRWFKKTSQTLMFMPYFVSFVILKVIVYNVFEYQYGVINNMLVGMGANRIDFYNKPSYWPFIITAFQLWKNIGYGMVVYLATITGIDQEMYEAAKVDGATIFNEIRYITLPQLKPTFIILLLYSLGGIMKGQFELFYQMVGNNGVLYNVTDIIDTYVYRIAMTQPTSIGLGTAAGLYQSVFGFVLIVVVNWIVKRRNEEYALF